jgi:hypothetical protein
LCMGIILAGAAGHSQSDLDSRVLPSVITQPGCRPSGR